MKTAIVGAGASGLSLALLLDGEVVIYEALDRAAGHCGSTIRDGWTFDRGPHIMFSKDKEVLDFMIGSLGDNVHQSRRNNKVLIDGRVVKYPIENDLGAMSEDMRNACLLDFLFNEHRSLAENPANLHEWFVGVFGSALTDSYFKPYNEKIWNVPLSELSMAWSERIPQPPAEDVVKGALGISTEGYLHQLFFHYPLRGGYEAIPTAWVRLLPDSTLRLSTPIRQILPAEGGRVGVVTDQGVEHFDRVVSTIPMDALLILAGDSPHRVREAVDALRINSIVVVTLGFEGIDENQFTAMYFPDPEFMVNRASSPCVFSPHNGPPGHYSIQAEITLPRGSAALGRSDDDFVEHVLKGLLQHGAVRADHPLVFTDVQRYEYAYVVYTVGYEHHVQTVREWAESRDIHLHGRFGSFDYLNVDGCVLRSIELASRLNKRPTSLAEIDLGGGRE